MDQCIAAWITGHSQAAVCHRFCLETMSAGESWCEKRAFVLSLQGLKRERHETAAAAKADKKQKQISMEGDVVSA